MDLHTTVGCRKVSARGSVERLLTDLRHRRSQWWFAAGTSLVFLTFSNLPLQICVNKLNNSNPILNKIKNNTDPILNK
jgi:hypothetical protein